MSSMSDRVSTSSRQLVLWVVHVLCFYASMSSMVRWLYELIVFYASMLPWVLWFDGSMSWSCSMLLCFYYLPSGLITHMLILVFLGFLLLSRITALWPRKTISSQVVRRQHTQLIYKTSHKVIFRDWLVLESGYCWGCDWLDSYGVVFFSFQKLNSANVWRWLCLWHTGQECN
jgi:hypothetical protein